MDSLSFVLAPSIEDRLSLRLISPLAEIENLKLFQSPIPPSPPAALEQDRLANLLGCLEINHKLNFIGCSTGRWASLAPFRILST